jgi:hypothetical protein
MTPRGNGLRGLVTAGLLSIVLVLAACGGAETSTTIPPTSTIEAPTTTTQRVTTTTQQPTTTTQQPTTTTQQPTTTTQQPTTTTQQPTTTTQQPTTTTQQPTTTTQAVTTTTVGPPAPVVTSLSPTKGPVAGGTTVVITGTAFVGLSGAGAVTFGGTNATAYTVDSPTKITATAPAHAAGPVRVKVTTPYGASANTAADDFTYVGAPTITGVAPTAGPSAGGTSVVISGTDLTRVTGVTFGGTVATFTIDSDTQITATAPAHEAGQAQVEISGATVDGPVDPNAPKYYYVYVDAPLINAVMPSRGPVAGGNEVIITGENFVDVTEVLFADAKADHTVDSPTQITAIAPAGYPGAVRVQVTALGGVSLDGISDDYTYSFVPGPPVPPSPGFWYKVLELLDEFFSR